MNSEVKGQWTAALRSGEYEQGSGVLRTIGNTYCCLGVLCELAVKANVIPVPVISGESYSYGPEGDRESWFLPAPVKAWAGIEASDPAVPNSEVDSDADVDDVITLSRMNDRGDTFGQIADAIDANL